MEKEITTVQTGQSGEENKENKQAPSTTENKDENKGGQGEDNKQDTSIPKHRFDEVNEAKKALEAKLKQFEDEKKAAELKKLEDEGKYKEFYEAKLKEVEAEKEKLRQEALDAKKESLVKKHKIPEKMSKLLTGNTVEELEASALELAEMVKEISGGDNKKEEGKQNFPEKKDPVNTVTTSGRKNNSIFDALKNAKELK